MTPSIFVLYLLKPLQPLPCDFDPDTRTCLLCKCLNRPCTFTIIAPNRQTHLQNMVQHFGELEELGTPVDPKTDPNILTSAPFDPRLEDEEHTDDVVLD